MYKLRLNLIISGLAIGFFSSSSILIAMQEQQSLDNVDNNKQLSIISTPNKDRRVMLYNPNIENKKFRTEVETEDIRFEQKNTKPEQTLGQENKEETARSKQANLNPGQEKKEEIGKPKPERPKHRPSTMGRVPKGKLPNTQRPGGSLKEPNNNISANRPEANETIYSSIRDHKYNLRKTGKIKDLIKNESVKPIFAEKVDKLTFYTNSKLNMEMLFNDLESSLQFSDKVSGKSDYAVINTRIKEIMNILVSAGKEIKKINTGETSNFSNKKPRLIALIVYAYNNCPSAVRDEFRTKIDKLFGNLNIDFNAPVFTKDTFK